MGEINPTILFLPVIHAHKNGWHAGRRGDTRQKPAGKQFKFFIGETLFKAHLH